jgi:hypothetical protein
MVINFLNIFTNHPKSVCMSYFEHLKFSFLFGVFFLKKSCQAFIHAFFPNLYITSTSDSVKQIEDELKNAGCR